MLGIDGAKVSKTRPMALMQESTGNMDDMYLKIIIVNFFFIKHDTPVRSEYIFSLYMFRSQTIKLWVILEFHIFYLI